MPQAFVVCCEVHGQEPWFFGFWVEADMEGGEECGGKAQLGYSADSDGRSQRVSYPSLVVMLRAI